MPKLHKFYELVSRTAHVALTEKETGAALFVGYLKNIPDCYDGWGVADFSISNDGKFVFQISK